MKLKDSGVKLIYYRGYILIRLKIIDTQWDIVKKLEEFNLKNKTKDWEITYVTPTYGGWDLLIECIFSSLSDLEKIISFCRLDNDLKSWIETTTTLISVRDNFQT
ncbi:MAG: hypothetical protein ACFFEO_12485 [Candidatus Thorarchaeota archaeon]